MAVGSNLCKVIYTAYMEMRATEPEKLGHIQRDWENVPTIVRYCEMVEAVRCHLHGNLLQLYNMLAT